MIKKILMIVIPSIILSACLYFSISSYIRYRQDYVSVFVASHQISQRTMMKEDDLKEIKVPKQILNDDIYVSWEDIVGRYVRMSHTIPKGSLIYKKALEDDIGDLAYTLLLEGQASYDLYASEVKMNAGSLEDGMYVDIYLTINISGKPVSDLLMKDCRIIGMYDGSGRQILSYDRDSRPYIVSIAIEKDDVSILNNTLKLGEVSVIVGNDTYQTNVRSSLNEDSRVYEYLT